MLERKQLYHKLKMISLLKNDYESLRRVGEAQDYNYYSIAQPCPRVASEPKHTARTQHSTEIGGSSKYLKLSKSNTSAHTLSVQHKGKIRSAVKCVGLVGVNLEGYRLLTTKVVTEPVEQVAARSRNNSN